MSYSSTYTATCNQDSEGHDIMEMIFYFVLFEVIIYRHKNKKWAGHLLNSRCNDIWQRKENYWAWWGYTKAESSQHIEHLDFQMCMMLPTSTYLVCTEKHTRYKHTVKEKTIWLNIITHILLYMWFWLVIKYLL